MPGTSDKAAHVSATRDQRLDNGLSRFAAGTGDQDHV
jgi:hypothetical protein